MAEPTHSKTLNHRDLIGSDIAQVPKMLQKLKTFAPRWVRKCWDECLGYRRKVDRLGFYGAVKFELQRRFETKGKTCYVQPRHAKYPIAYRVGSSDPDVFHQIFIDIEYAPLSSMRNVGLVIDGGANVGYSSAFFLSQFPSCSVIAIEPDSKNCSILEENLKEYGGRGRAIRAGIWSKSGPLKVVHGGFRDGREWTVQVRSCQSDEKPDVLGVSIESLLENSGFDRISLLKLDIEGSEVEVFENGSLDWLNRVDAIAIELHDDTTFGNASKIIKKVIADFGFETVSSGELTICRRT